MNNHIIYIAVIIVVAIFISKYINKRLRFEREHSTRVSSKNELLRQKNIKLVHKNQDVEEQYNKLLGNLSSIVKTRDNLIPKLTRKGRFCLLEPGDEMFLLFDPMVSDHKVGLINFSNSKTYMKNPNSTTLYIQDIQVTPKYENKGYATVLLNHLFDYAKLNEFKQIKGELAQTDIDHHDKLIYLYKKMGFEVVMKYNHTGIIIKTL